MRYGMLREVGDAFDMAEEMCGCHHPDEIEEDRRRIRSLKAEVLTILRAAKNFDMVLARMSGRRSKVLR